MRPGGLSFLTRVVGKVGGEGGSLRRTTPPVGQGRSAQPAAVLSGSGCCWPFCWPLPSCPAILYLGRGASQRTIGWRCSWWVLGVSRADAQLSAFGDVARKVSAAKGCGPGVATQLFLQTLLWFRLGRHAWGSPGAPGPSSACLITSASFRDRYPAHRGPVPAQRRGLPRPAHHQRVHPLATAPSPKLRSLQW